MFQFEFLNSNVTVSPSAFKRTFLYPLRLLGVIVTTLLLLVVVLIIVFHKDGNRSRARDEADGIITPGHVEGSVDGQETKSEDA